MSTAEGRRRLSQKNQSLRQSYNRLKDKKMDLEEHLATLQRRLKQMIALKQSLLKELRRAEDQAKISRNKKVAYIGFLREEIIRLDGEFGAENLKLKNIEAQYQVCLKDYDNVVRASTVQIEKVKVLQTQILKEKEYDSNMKTMIFDYERLKRVLEEQKKYFKELSSSEEKSHEERVRQLSIIQHKLSKEEQKSGGDLKLSKIRIGMSILHHLYLKRYKQYGERFLTHQIHLSYKTQLGIRIFKNCLQIGTFKHRQSMRKIFSRWHHNIFPKGNLRNLVQNTLINDIDSKKRIMLLNKMLEKANTDNMSLFHLYEKMRFLMVTANKVSRKDMHYGFSRWRNNYKHRTQKLNNLTRIFNKTIPTYEMRTSFKLWKINSYQQGRLERANHLLSQFVEVKQVSRIFRKWRFQCSNMELKTIDDYIYNIKLRNKISSRINYEKRKSKALTTLALKMTKVKLRNYFIKYWRNVKYYKVEQKRQQIQSSREEFSELRNMNKNVTHEIEEKDQKFSLKAFRSFMMNMKLKPVMKKWRNTVHLMKRRSEVLFHLALRREGRAKLHVMNEFRRCVQYYEKKQMHQVLTDLNNKMQAINEKSTAFRDRLKKCIEELGIMASKKVGSTYNYSVKCQTRVYFDQDLRLRVRKVYRLFILSRLEIILSNYCTKNAFNQILVHSKNKKREKLLEQRLAALTRTKQIRTLEKIFYTFKNSYTSHKGSFKKMIQAENILMFYRMASAFVAVERKYVHEKTKAKKKEITAAEASLQAKQENLQNLGNQKLKLQNSLKKIFSNFVNFENRNMEIKDKNLTQWQMKRYFNKYRENVREKIYMQKILVHFSGFLNQKNQFIFWKGLTAIRYQKMTEIVKEQLSKINKKKKAFLEKRDKGKWDTLRKLQEEKEVHATHKHYYEYYLTKFESILEFYKNKHFENEKQHYLKQVFHAWKHEYLGSKKIALGINKVLQKKLVHSAFKTIGEAVKKMEARDKSEMMCADILLKKGRRYMRDCMMMWRCNMRNMQCEKMEHEVQEILQKKKIMNQQCREKANFISSEVIRVNKRKTLIKCFMFFKNEVMEKKATEKLIKPMNEKVGRRIVATCIKGWKWYMYFKRTKKSFIEHKKKQMNFELMRDVFQSLKIYRQEHYKFMNKTSDFVGKISYNYLRYSLDKIINIAAYQRDELNYERRKALRHLVMNKVSRVDIIKRKIMAKWHAWLIPRTHYLPNVLKELQIRALRRYFGNIRQHAYWNDYYIKNAADKITNEGYNDINSATNNLVKEGYDPDQLKEFMKTKNDKDTALIKRVVNHINSWKDKEDMVRAFHSWQQYIQLKRKIKKSLSKVLNIAQGIGRYWNRWKSKDPEFNATLEKQSRGNMLQKYRELNRLLKQYKRDIKDSKVYCEELKQINDEYHEKNRQGVKMALLTLSDNVKVGLRQGMHLWRKKVREGQRHQMDERYDQLSQGIKILFQQRNSLHQRLSRIQEQNTQMKEKCNLGAECGKILQKLLTQRDSLSIDLADKEHNLKLLLEDNLRLKQKIRAAQDNAEKLIQKIQKAQDD